MRRILIGLGIFGFALLLGACDGRKACKDSVDCRVGESCMWIHDDDGLRCLVQCGSDAECKQDQHCTLGASSCQTCQDLARFCK
jgi:hypothetical protein